MDEAFKEYLRLGLKKNVHCNWKHLELVLEQLIKDYSAENTKMLIETLNSNELKILNNIAFAIDAGVQYRENQIALDLVKEKYSKHLNKDICNQYKLI
tara:strand:- start:1556 stop:1849 length:294 start_codon:yes stop_codon:yes gene_type:complete